jgi:hypothetical protein
VATAKQLQGQLKKLNARIAKQKADLATNRAKQKKVKMELASAKQAAKAKAAKAK